ncbi:MAG: DUF3368 domain-containing protein [Caldilineae bacterium]|nr:MAG: DUF3368 domain-containing protein [Caldilineae bacterium]
MIVIALLDNTVLSNFAVVERSDLVQAALHEKCATLRQVLDEHQTGVQLGRLPSVDWSWLPILTLEDDELQLYKQLRTRLNAGEAACLSKAARGGYILFTDDRDARAVAAQMQIPVSGTLGLFMLLLDHSLLSLPEADNLLAQMVSAGYRSPVQSLEELL